MLTYRKIDILNIVVIIEYYKHKWNIIWFHENLGGMLYVYSN